VIHVLSLGAGVQSSTLALMAKHGLVTPMPDCAIFADTGWEPKAVYEWLNWLETQLPFPVNRVSNGNIRLENMDGASKPLGRTTMPFFTSTNNGIALRKCTKEYKIDPIEKFIRQELLGLKKGERVPNGTLVEQWRGISADEAQRMKPSEHKWMWVRYPLAMELKMTRGDCLAWMERNGYPTPPRSACIGCPYHSDHEWMEIRKRPEEWADAIEFDKAIRNAGAMRGETFLHKDRIPLDKVQFRKDQQPDLWGEECEGMCGV
jgi:hypothetical protein